MTPVPGAGFSRFLDADPDRLHVAAHSHHPWPDVSFDGQQQAWHDAARLIDRKWDLVFNTVLPETQGHVAARLGLPDATTVVIAPNTHELLMRILSCMDPPMRVLTTDGEFTSFERQIRRLAEDGLVDVERVPVAPLDSAAERLAGAAARGGHDLVWFSHVFYGSGAVIGDLEQIVAAVPDDDTFIAIDGYHGFMALPTDLSAVAGRAFYLAGGYKYAMSGEGVCFAHCPPGYGQRPRDTGWFADFSSLSASPGDRISYAPDGQRFFGATFDPTPLYRFNAVQRWLSDVGWTVPGIHRHVSGLQQRFLDGLTRTGSSLLTPGALIAAPGGDHEHGHLLAFERPHAGAVTAALRSVGVVVDHRGTRVRIGFGVYHDADDVGALLERSASVTLPPGLPGAAAAATPLP
jgi:selenocysteine lyase/cysteine desulfurase